MRAGALALPVLLALLSAPANAVSEPQFATGLQALPDLDGRTILLLWDDTGGPYAVLRDGEPLAVVSEPRFLDGAPLPSATYGILALGASGPAVVVSDRIGLLVPDGPSDPETCEPTGVGIVDTPPFVLVALYENCLPVNARVPRAIQMR